VTEGGVGARVEDGQVGVANVHCDVVRGKVYSPTKVFVAVAHIVPKAMSQTVGNVSFLLLNLEYSNFIHRLHSHTQEFGTTLMHLTGFWVNSRKG
jgi:hypothetical protein